MNPSCAEMLIEGVVGVDELVTGKQLRQAIRLRRGESQHLAHLAHRAPWPVGDHVGGHACAVRAVACVYVLQDLLSAIPRGQIQVDVWPLAPLLVEKAFKQKLVTNGVDRRDAERVADQTIGRRASSLHQDSPRAALAHDVPHDQEIPFELELVDDAEFMLHLMPDPGRDPSVALAGTRLRERAKLAYQRLAVFEREVGKAVIQVLERELAAFGDFQSVV